MLEKNNCAFTDIFKLGVVELPNGFEVYYPNAPLLSILNFMFLNPNQYLIIAYASVGG